MSADDVAGVTNLFGYQAAVLLDKDGRALRVSPPKASLIGQDLTKTYAHLRAAARGQTAVSKVVPSAAKGIPIVAFATPFNSKDGRRVFSGAFDVEQTPIGAYLHHATSLKGTHVYLLDQAGVIVASNRDDLRGVKTLAQADPSLAKGLQQSSADDTNDGQQYASRPVAGAPWRLVMSARKAELFGPVQGFNRYVPWVLWAGFVFGGLACAVLVSNVIASRASLREANENLDRLAHVDGLTQLDNRRRTQVSLDGLVANAERHAQSLSVLMIDVDRFKEINDGYGHEIGDHVLRFVAAAVRAALRQGDLVGRWGGEEFLVLLPFTDRHGAEVVAERVRAAVALAPGVVADQLVPVTVSIGAATREDELSDALAAKADTAMYAAKATGRDSVCLAP